MPSPGDPPSLSEGGASEQSDTSGGCPGRRGVNVIPADAGTQRKTKHATTPFFTRKGRERAKRCERGMLEAAGGKRHSRGRALCPTSVIPADAGIQRKTKHATTPFFTRRGRERANRCERGMLEAAGGKRHSRGRALCPTSVIPADAGIQRKTKHATTPFATRWGRERAKRCPRGAGGKRHSRGRGNPEARGDGDALASLT